MHVKTHATSIQATQELFPAEAFLGDALERLKTASIEDRGAIFTRTEVVDFMLDLLGYTQDKPLWNIRILEPSFGGGEFLLRAVSRLIRAARRDHVDSTKLSEAVCGVELHRDSFEDTRTKLRELLAANGMSSKEATQLTNAWLVNGDFLLEPLAPFDLIVGNPPYVRQELIPAEMLAAYRKRFTTLYDRADLYVPFMERSLQLLKSGGQMSFICSDRWMKNRYGGPLRAMISEGYTLRYYVDMVGTAAFQTDVVAYPAITVIQRGKSSAKARIAHRPEVSAPELESLHRALIGPPSGFNGTVIELSTPSKGDDPWLMESDALPSLDFVRRLESAFPTIEAAGCSVGIGVATGADKIYIGPYDELDVEDERKLPLATTRDILSGKVEWRGLGVINPFEEDGTLADFERYPRFGDYMERHRELLQARHCAQRANGSWYRTIDRITPSITQKPKLLIPDIKGEASIVLDEGRLYPHHNLYYITSQYWPLTALQTVLRSGIAHLFVRAYSTKMRGGSLRFQAQYLRRIRLPFWQDVPPGLRETLQQCASGDMDEARAIVGQLYNLTDEEIDHLNT